MRGGTAAPVPRGSRHARRARLWLITGSSILAAVVGAILLLRPSAAPYTPGTDEGAQLEITRRLARERPEGAPPVTFSDAAAEAGITFRHFAGRRSTQLPEDMGSGAAWGDYDGDGDPDLYLVNESGPLGADGRAPISMARSTLLRNDAGRFTDVTDAAGVGAAGLGMGAAWGDYDGDADLDLAVTRFGTILLYRNDGGRFEEVSVAAGVGRHEGFWTGATWGDHDRDGDLDLYVCGYVRYRYDPVASSRSSFQYGSVQPFTLNPSSYEPERNLLLRNERGVFREVGRAAGVDNPKGRSLSATWCDFDGDGWPDLYVANDVSDNAMFHNQRDGTFRDVSHPAWVADHRGAMGLAIGDWENDGDFDIFITHWIAQENALYVNQAERMTPTPDEPMHFIDHADMQGLGQIALDFVGWGTGFLDYDNDGRLDLFVANGSTFQRDDDPALLVPMRNLLFWNAGPDKGYYELGPVSGAPFGIENVGRGAAFADYDADGDIDVAVTVNGGPARLLRNEGPAGSWLRVILRADPAARRPARGPATTTYANGALVRVTAGGVTSMREIGAGSSYLSQDPPGEAHFGLGTAQRVDRLEVRWPDGEIQTFEDLPAPAVVSLVQGGRPRIVPAAGFPE